MVFRKDCNLKAEKVGARREESSRQEELTGVRLHLLTRAVAVADNLIVGLQKAEGYRRGLFEAEWLAQWVEPTAHNHKRFREVRFGMKQHLVDDWLGQSTWPA